MRFSPDFLDDIRSRVRLSDVIARRVALKKRGREHLGLCPFHKEKTPSFTVNEEKGFFHCFGCGAHGDVIEFMMRSEGLAFPETVERLAGMAGLAVPVETPEERERARERQTLYDVLEAACAWFERQLQGPAGRRARDYLKGRGVDDDARFRLGFAPDSRGALKAALGEGGPGPAGGADRFPEPLLVTAGLLIEPEGEGAPYDRFRGRIIFPITDRRGRVIAFGGRALGEGTPKYLNSPDTPLFHKGRVLYGLAAARKAALEAGEVIVTEGYMDVIALHKAGFPNAVAPLGTALTEDQIGELWRLAPEPLLCFDGDEAGRRAAAAAAERALPLLSPGCSLRFAALPPGEDPDSLIRAGGPEAVREVLARARPLADLVWEVETAGRAFDTPERRASLRKRLEERAARIADARVRAEYLRHFTAMRMETLGPRPARRGRAVSGPAPHPAPQDAGRGTKARVESQALWPNILLAAVLNHPDLLDEVAEELGTLAFSEPQLDGLRQQILEAAGNPALDTASLKSHLIDQGYSGVLRSLLHQDSGTLGYHVGPEEPTEKVRGVWRAVHAKCLLPNIRAQVGEAQRVLEAETTPENLKRFQSLKKHLDEVQAVAARVE
jgi:DNA primase